MLTSGDRVALEATARLVAKGRNPDGLTGAELGHLRGFLSGCGHRPPPAAGCCRPEAPAGNPWDVAELGRA